MTNIDPLRLARLLLLLSATTGVVDAVSVLGLGRVFTANMTGNIVFFGFAVVATPGFAALPCLVALAGFLAGALAGGRLARRHIGGPLRQWLVKAAVLEASMLWLAAALALLPAWPQTVVIACTAFAMGLRNATVRQLKVPDLTTTVLTMTITGIAADSRAAGGVGEHLGRRAAAVAAILVGAAIGAAMVNRVGLTLPLALVGAIVLLGTLTWVREPEIAARHR